MEMEESVVLVSLCCFFAHICSRPSLLLSTDRVPRQAEKAQPNGCAFLMLFSDVNDLQLARLEERLNQVLQGMAQDRESQKQQYEKTEELAQSITKLDGRMGQVEQSLTQQAPTIEEFITIKHKVVGAGIAGKWVWAIASGLITFIWTAKKEIAAWLGN